MLILLRRSVLVTLVFFVLLGLAYPLAETGIAQAFLSHHSCYTPVSTGGRPELIATGKSSSSRVDPLGLSTIGDRAGPDFVRAGCWRRMRPKAA
jgi:hypothetical protein